MFVVKLIASTENLKFPTTDICDNARNIQFKNRL